MKRPLIAIVLIVAAASLAGLALSTRSRPRVDVSAAPTTTTADPASRGEHPAFPRRAAFGGVRADTPSAIGGLPHNLKDVPMTPALEAGLRNWTKLAGDDPQVVENLNYKLRLLADIQTCATAAEPGWVDVVIHFEPGANGTLAVAKFEFKQVVLSAETRAAALPCIESSINGTTVALVNEDDKEGFASPMRIRFPVEESGIYKFLETGDTNFLMRQYDRTSTEAALSQSN